MSGNFAGYRRVGSNGIAARPQPKGPGRHDWLMAISIPSLAVSGISLVVCSIVFILTREETSAEDAASTPSIVVENRSYGHRERGAGDGCPGARCPQMAELPEAGEPGPEAIAPAPEEQKPGRKASGSTLPLPLPDDAADKAGHRTWLNETGANRDAITLWNANNANEEFASLGGIGQFFWFPAGKTPVFAESFPHLLEFVRQQNPRLPGWFDSPPCPWPSRADVTKDFHSSMMRRCPVVQSPEARKPGLEKAALPPEQKSGRETSKAALPRLVLPDDVASKVGYRVWQNETGGSRDGITSWNANEDFASLGIGHFIWYPAGRTPAFEESFPRLLEFLRQQNVRLPGWLDKTPIPPCPWASRADFTKDFHSSRMTELRQFLLDTVAGQTQFLVTRAQGAMDKILEGTPEGDERQRIIAQFSRIAHASKDLYPLIDYINFKGEGTNPAETAPDRQTGTPQGWGLKQVLLKMNGSTSEPTAVLAEFSDAAHSVLLQRIRNIPANRVWEAGWSRRVGTYRRPII